MSTAPMSEIKDCRLCRILGMTSCAIGIGCWLLLWYASIYRYSNSCVLRNGEVTIEVQ